MSAPLILVTGATGRTGAAVVAQLREKGWPVRAVVRSRDARSERLDRLGAETVVADLFDPDQLLEALRGTSRAYYCPPFHPYMIESAAAFAVAAREARLEAIVGLSQWLASPAHPSLATRQLWLADHLFATIPDVAHTIVRPGFFADNYLRLIGFAAQLGVLPSLTGDSRNAPPSNEDIARVAVAALTDPGTHAGRAYRPTGPALLSTRDMADILSKVLGRNVRRLEMPIWMFLKVARMQGVDPFEMSGFRHYVEDHKQGAFEVGAPTNDVFNVSGQQPEDFETTARRYAASPNATRSFGAGLRAWGDFLRTPVSPGYDLGRFERQQGFPVPPVPRLAMDDERWKRDRGALFSSPSTVESSRPEAVA
jgi:uncharacterized protein YbjT (DUF2867 family)